VNGK